MIYATKPSTSLEFAVNEYPETVWKHPPGIITAAGMIATLQMPDPLPDPQSATASRGSVGQCRLSSDLLRI